MKKRLLLIVVSLLLLISSGVVLAAYSADITVTENGTGAHEMLACDVPANIDYMAANDFFALATGLDTRVQKGGIDQPHMLRDDTIMFATPVPQNSTSTLQFVTDETPQDFYIVPGYSDNSTVGFITTLDDVDLELGNDFAIEQKGWVNTDNASDKNLVYKEDAFRTFISPTVSGNITSEIKLAHEFPTVEAVNGGSNASGVNHTVNLPAGVNAGDLLIAFFATKDNPAVTFPAGWTQLFDTPHTGQARLVSYYRVSDGGEGASITVTTGWAETSSYTTYRISGYTGTPEAGVAAVALDDSPNPPNLTPSWGADSTLWFVAQGHQSGDQTTSAYPANFADGREDLIAGAQGCTVSTARRELNAVSEDPGVFTITTGVFWVANTVAIQPDDAVFTVTATGVLSGEHDIVVGADGVDFWISVDGAVAPAAGYDEVALAGAAVPDNANNWIIGQNNVMPYMEYYKHTTAVGGSSLKAWYQPIDIIAGTVLPDRQGADEPGAFTWGSNPIGIAVTLGAMSSDYSGADVDPAGAQDIAPVLTPPPASPADAARLIGLADNPLTPIIHIFSEVTGIYELWFWWVGSIIIGLMLFGLSYKWLRNMILSGSLFCAVIAFFIALGVYDLWVVMILIVILFGCVMMQSRRTA